MKLVSAQVTSVIADPNSPVNDKTKQAVVALLEYHNTCHGLDCPVVFPIAKSVNHYQFSPDHFVEKPTHSVTPFMHPLLLGCYSPDRVIENERQAVKGRVLDVKGEGEVTAFLDQVMDEFLQFLFPEQGTLHPVDPSEVYTRQDRPSQRRLLQEVDQIVWCKRKFATFLKAESYDEPKDPRIIAVINAKDKLDYSCFIYALTDQFVEADWYAFGKTPREIAQIVVNICVSAKLFVDTSDLSRMDGHVNNVMRYFERKVLCRAFHRSYHAELLELHGSQYGHKAYTTNGIIYDPGDVRQSGSPETAGLNSVDNMFIGYLAARLDGISPGLSPEKAWENRGVYGGDDALNKDIPADKLMRAARMMGQVLKSNVIMKGQPGVEFLARRYSPDVWTGEPDSCCDLKRQLIKFHVTVNLAGVSPVTKLLEKCLAYYLTDACTPLLGAFCAKVLDLADVDKDNIDAVALNRKIVPYFSRYSREVQFPNANVGGWMWDEIQKAVPGIEVGHALAWIDGLRKVEDALKPPLWEHPDPKICYPDKTVVVNGVIYYPLSTEDCKEKPPTRTYTEKTDKHVPVVSKKGKRVSFVDLTSANVFPEDLPKATPRTMPTVPGRKIYKAKRNLRYHSGAAFSKSTPPAPAPAVDKNDASKVASSTKPRPKPRKGGKK
jgi:hypothetical protein